MIEQRAFGEYSLYILSNDNLRLAVTDLGATAVSLRYCGQECLLGYDSPEGYLAGTGFVGAAVGRYANRIGGAAFTLGGVSYTLAANEGKNQLHGGPDSYDRRRWTADTEGDRLRFTLFSPDGDNGFPGNLTAQITYSLTGDTLWLDFEAESDADTVYAPTSHMYFDLSGRGKALEAKLQLGASGVLEVDEGLIPTGRRLPAEGRFDFSKMRTVAEDYDHCFTLDSDFACALEDGDTRMEVYTDLPAVQIYTGKYLPQPLRANQGLAIEPEFYPDSPNHPDFPDTTLRKGEHFHRWAEYRFSKR